MGATAGDATLSELGEAALAYVGMGLAVVPLRARSKEPATRHGLNDWTDDPESVRAIWSAHPDLNVGVVCGAPSGGLVVLDLDEHDGGASGWESLRAWERGHGALPATASAVTGSGGYHMWYRSAAEVRPSVNAELAVDVRGEGSYVVAPPSVHPLGRRYEWEEAPDEVPMAEADAQVMAFLAHVRPAGRGGDGGRYELPATVGQGGRNDAMYRFGASMRAKGLDDAVIADAMRGVNATRLSPPLGDDELERTISSVLALRPGRSEEFERARARASLPPSGRGEPGPGDVQDVDARPIDDEGDPIDAPGAEEAMALGIVRRGSRGGLQVVHNKFGRCLIERDHACRIGSEDGVPAIWNGQRYVVGWESVERAVTRRYDGAKQADRNEVREYVRCAAPVVQEADPRYVAFRNCVLDVVGGVTMPLTPDLVITNVIPHDYRAPDAEAMGLVDGMFGRVSDGNDETLRNLYQVLGLCIYRCNDFGRVPLFVGEGSNGKSIVLRLIRGLLGPQNYATLELSSLKKDFHISELAGKLANVGDDISSKEMGEDVAAMLRKLCTGEAVYGDVKGKSGFTFVPRCTMIYSANEVPTYRDNGVNMTRRMFPIEFRRRFSRADPDYDPHISARLAEEGSMRAVVALAVQGLQDVIENNGMTGNAATRAMLDELRVRGDSVLQWVEDEELRRESFLGMPTSAMFHRYRDWCRDDGGVKNIANQNTFTRRVKREFGLESGTSRLENGAVRRCFVDGKGA